MRNDDDTSLRHWGIAWVGLALALALHATDEALTGFLPLYNQIIDSVRESIPWFPFPTFTFDVWIAGLTILVLALLALSPLVFKGHAWPRPVNVVEFVRCLPRRDIYRYFP